MRFHITLLIVGIALASTLALAQPASQPADPTARVTTRPAASQSSEKEKDKNGDRISVTRHSISLAGKTLNYTASAGTMVQRDEAGAAKADMFFVAYILDREDKNTPTTRPITFVFNGGPGAASVWLHLGTAGPKRVDIQENAIPSAPPFHLVENESCWLGATDLVFIDPVGTGYSRPAQGEKGEQFYGVTEDIRSVGAFIRLYITRNERWDSPKFLAGESYGTTRAAGLSEYLLDKCGISLNGIALISSALNFQAFVAGGGNELPYVTYLPTFTATAWSHKKLGAAMQADLAKTLREVEEFAIGDYARALAKGDSLPDEQRQAIARKLSSYTGLSIDYILRVDLRIDPTRFRKQLLADEKKIIGRFDGRTAAFDPDPAGAEADFDPSFSQVVPVYSAGLNDYVRRELDFESDLPYEVLTERVHPWNFGNKGFGYLYVADTLRQTMLKNPQLRVLFAAGQMDLATPYFSSDYTIDHLQLPPALQKNLTRTYYPAGHMMYHEATSRRRLHDDIAGFISASLAPAK